LHNKIISNTFATEKKKIKMNKLVKFKLAKLLKEKGFNRPVSKCYNTYGKINMLISVYNCEFPEDMNGERHKITPNVYANPPYYSAPTIAEVVMWLYEEFGIWISVLQHTKNGKGIYFESVVNSMTFSGYDTPKEAYESAIEYTLNNLI
jgi:hypothetical protein